MKKVRGFRLRTILIIVNLVVLILPFGGIVTLRLYESELVRQTEASLIAQGAFVESGVRVAAVELFARKNRSLSDVSIDAVVKQEGDGKLTPIRPTLTLSESAIRIPAEPAMKAQTSPDPMLVRAATSIEPMMKEAQRTTLAGIRVVDANGVVIATTRGERGESLSHREEVQRALAGEPVSLLRRRISDSPTPDLKSISRRSSVRVFFALPIRYDDKIIGAVSLSRTPVSLEKAIYRDRNTYTGFILLILGAALFISLLTAFTIQRPIRQLITLTRKVEEGEEPLPIDRPGTREVQELSDAITTMAATLNQRADYIRDFARSVSHEFKTPITSLRGTVELLQDHVDTMTDEERDAFFVMIDHDAQRMQRLVEGLLDLARADVADRSRDPIDIETVLQDVQNVFDPGFVVVSGEFAPVLMRHDGAEAIFTNLARNAQEASAKTCLFEGSIVDDALEIRVIDDGDGIDEPDRPRIFESFFTSKRDSGGTGLGLSIVRSLMHSVDGTLELVASSEKGTTFLLRFPTAR